ncbi:MAG: class I tRNA ligase family protein, partial [Caulobacterales bacterium]|nr:class I tRNA ligase family protein [Caulobacterales bacterium]
MTDASTTASKSNRKTSANAEADTGRDYRDTLFLPHTEFPMRAGLPKAEPVHLKRWEESDLHGRLRKQSKGRETFVLHDGPPYANGHLHIGHALNKILKDIVVRSHQMAGFDAIYIPGWDCHGLPIEWKVEEAFRAKGRRKDDVAADEFRTACRAYASEWVDIQREEFKRFGVMGDWDAPYTTMDYEAEAAIVGEFLKFAESGQLYRGSKPVMWSPVERTALAEAEVEYHDHTSHTIWVKFPIVDYRGDPKTNVFTTSKTQIVIWTTTPWTIPGNRAIAYSPSVSYGLYEVIGRPVECWATIGDRYIMADALAA